MRAKNKDLYYESLEAKANKEFTGAEQNLALLLIKLMDATYIVRDTNLQEIRNILFTQKSPRDPLIFQPLVEIVHTLIGAEYGALFQYIIDHKCEYPYSEGYSRRPFRTRNLEYHYHGMIESFLYIFDLDFEEFSIIDYLSCREGSPIYNPLISDVIAYEIDQKNERVIQALSEVIFGENNTALLTYEMIKGVFKSHSQEGYTMLGDLLLAARLQEGLRQSIVENIDEGTLEATIYMLKVILDHELIRYSSVVRALDVWTGLDLQASDNRVTKRSIQYAADSLSNRELREEGVRSENLNTLFISLWATAVNEEDDIKEPIQFLMENGETYQKVMAQFFLTQSQNASMRFELAHPFLFEKNGELQYYLLKNYVYDYDIHWSYESEKSENTLTINQVPLLENKKERSRQFELFKNMFLQMPKREVSIESKAIQGLTLFFSRNEIARKMMFLTAYDLDKDWLRQLIESKDKLSAELREDLLSFFIKDDSDKTQRDFLFASLADKSVNNREIALAHIKSMELMPEEIEKIEAILKLKTGALRQGAIQILLGLPKDHLEPALDRLLSSKAELQRLGALEILSEINDQAERERLVKAFKNTILQMKAGSKEQILLDKLFQTKEYNLDNGFGLYDPNHRVNLELEHPKQELKNLLQPSPDSSKQFLQGLAALVHEHRQVEYEVEWYDGSKDTLHIGEELRCTYSYQEDEKQQIDQLPLAEVWKEYINTHKLTAPELIQTAFYLHADRILSYYSNRLDVWEVMDYPQVEGWRKTFLEEIYPIENIEEVNRFLDDLNYRSQVETLFDAYFTSQDSKELFDNISAVLNFLVHSIPEDKLKTEYKLLDFLIDPWLEWAEHFADITSESFDVYFKLHYQLYTMANFESFLPSMEDLAKAYARKIIDEQVIFQELLGRDETSRDYVSELTNPKDHLLKNYPDMIPIKDRVVQRILEIELKRGDLPTEVTTVAMGIERHEGIGSFVQILLGLDKESFVRGYIYGYGSDLTKKEVFSHLLKTSYPKEGDSDAQLKHLLKGKALADKRLLEAAMYAPQWLDIVSKHLNWNGLRSAAWYFHAHINETFSEEKETIVAHFSPISPQEFQDGAFDIRWFKESYEQLGEERFQILYQRAKYISAGANHRRSQLFADAVLGKLALENTKNLVQEKRTKDQVLCYSLIPVKNEQDVLERYIFLQRFLQESKKFGAQRRSSESKTVTIALDNLTRNAGYKDVTRLKWAMESKKMEEIAPFLEPKVMDDLTVQLVIDANGRGDIKAVKGDKALKTLPAKYNKQDYIVVLKGIKSDLREQYKRAKEELERSMELGNSFLLSEVYTMMKNPVLTPLMTSLVLKVGNYLGFFEDGSLYGVGTVDKYSIQATDEIFIAHPVHLFESGQWSEFQRDLFARKVKQPFKQVFRELYLPNQDELALGTGTRRYAGHKIQPQKTVAILKSRLWTTSYETGLQKVYYKENIIVQLNALADWFSPSDVECPTLETIEFFDRLTYQPLEIKSIPKVIFSETMRDIDLVVSIAHVGGVDPEASLTTIEMRKVIVTESVRLMRLENVRIEGNFALINGSIGDYSVHLGSANVYKQATGAIYIVPVHSQQRGRIFLPFMDEDPKTAEIVSKVLLLAEDKKIKDPFILAQIRN
ncbi:DUF4132 domain-containing protein [Bacillus sp. AFS031507]|uniref:DUF4132 domain-containing protein n=1 Tax=Bacillus sp. AFS031507 TaxID=2033496 RepID=UPI000BFDCC9D|nr:DUF4132 domain-containing protein [Bacillus sp. AFS031507]PGY08375.1 hypothetical protein COE25_20625 [Bacillus sp. AFS031507]